ncbi:MAG: PfkB family carbohydrate kinase, partial [Pseudomonadota bacterium]
MTRLLICGSAVTDLIFEVPDFPTKPEKYTAEAARIVGGGCAGNASVAAARLGADVTLVARVARDLIGDMTLADLTAERVDTAHVLRSDHGQSAYSAIHITPDGERMITAFRGRGLAETADVSQLSADAVLVDTRWPAAAETVLARAATLGVPGVLDAEAPVADALAFAASHVAFSAQGLRAYAGVRDLRAALATVAARLPGWVCVTDGAAGVTVAGNPPQHFPAFPADVVDTLGAGDVWHGAFALALAEGRGEDGAIRFASAAAALKCQRPGGRLGAPDR